MDLLRFVSASGQPVASFVSETWAAYTGASQWTDVPPVEASMRLIGESVMDQTFGVLVNLLIGVPAPEQIRKANEDVVRMQAFLSEGGWLQSPLGYHQRPAAPREWTLRDETAWYGATRQPYQHLEFDSGFQTRPGEPGGEEWVAKEHNQRQHAYVLEHEGEPRPWLVCVHGFTMGTPMVNFIGFDVRRLHHELGLNLIFPCLPLHGPRSSTTMSGGELLQPDYLNVVHTFSQAIWDVRRTISWVRERGAPKIGIYGISLGGHNASMVSAMEPDLDCVIAGIPAVDFSSLARDNEPYIIRRYTDEFSVPWDLVRSISHVVSPLSFTPLAPRNRRFIYAGTADRVARPVHARALWRHWDRPKIHWFAGGHVLAIANPAARAFVEQSLRDTQMV
ncbi:MAG: alpha/beta hydrolase family protein [Candidatus Binatia bacterium]|nr:alpha/beta hydrolase family protein [Candidatus Binatia bacterium]